MTYHGIQPSFVGGEITPLLQGNITQNLYSVGLKKAENFIVHPQGSVSNRAGSFYAGNTKYVDKTSRNIEFIPSSTDRYVIELGDYYARFYYQGVLLTQPVLAQWRSDIYYQANDIVWFDYLLIRHWYQANAKNINVVPITSEGASLLWTEITIPAWDAGTTYFVGEVVDYNSGYYRAIQNNIGQDPEGDTDHIYWITETILEVTTPYASEDINDIQYTQSVDVLYLTSKKYPIQTIIRSAVDFFYIEPFQFSSAGIPFLPMNSNTNIKLRYDFCSLYYEGPEQIGVFHNGTNYFQLKGFTEASSVWTNINSISEHILKFGRSFTVTISDGWTGTIAIGYEKNPANSDYSQNDTYKQLKLVEATNNTQSFSFQYTFEDSMILRVDKVSTDIFGTCSVTLYSDGFSGRAIFDITNFLTSKHVLVDTIFNSLDIWQEGGLSPDIPATFLWSEAAFSHYRGWPGTSCFYQDRFWLASTYSYPSNIWASKTGNYLDFGTSDPLVDTDGISLSLLEREGSEIQHLVYLHYLIILTSSGLWSVSPSQTSAITPFSIDLKPHVFFGSNKTRPIVYGNTIVYASNVGSDIIQTWYDYQAGGFTYRILNLASSHLMQNKFVVSMALQKHPYHLIWFLMNDGQLVSNTLVQEQEVNAWTPMTTVGSIESICSLPGGFYGNGIDELWMVTNRTNGRFQERMFSRFTDDTSAMEAQYFLDCGKVFGDLHLNFFIQDIDKVADTALRTKVYIWHLQDYNFSDGDLVTITGSGISDLNNHDFIITLYAETYFLLRDPITLDYIEWNSGWPPFAEGGSVYNSRLDLSVDSVNISSSLGILRYRAHVKLQDFDSSITELSNGNLIYIDNVQGMIELNGKEYSVSDYTSITTGGMVSASFYLKDPNTLAYIDVKDYGDYLQGGFAKKLDHEAIDLTHLNGETVGILLDGVYQGTQTVINNTITIDSAFSLLFVGLPYKSIFQTLPISLSDQSGTYQDKKLRIGNCSLNVFSTYGGSIGIDPSYMQQLDYPTSNNSLYTGLLNKSFTAMFRELPSIYVRQEQPYPITILSCMPRITFGG